MDDLAWKGLYRKCSVLSGKGENVGWQVGSS